MSDTPGHRTESGSSNESGNGSNPGSNDESIDDGFDPHLDAHVHSALRAASPSNEAPPALLDRTILEAAKIQAAINRQRQAGPAAAGGATPGLWQRLHGWTGAGSLAVALIAGLMVWRAGPDPVPPAQQPQTTRSFESKDRASAATADSSSVARARGSAPAGAAAPPTAIGAAPRAAQPLDTPSAAMREEAASPQPLASEANCVDALRRLAKDPAGNTTPTPAQAYLQLRRRCTERFPNARWPDDLPDPAAPPAPVAPGAPGAPTAPTAPAR